MSSFVPNKPLKDDPMRSIYWASDKRGTYDLETVRADQMKEINVFTCTFEESSCGLENKNVMRTKEIVEGTGPQEVLYQNVAGAKNTGRNFQKILML